MYIGKKEIETIDGNVVTFKDGSTEQFSSTELKYIQTEEPKDLTELRDIKVREIVADIMKIFDIHDVQKWDIQAVIQTIISSYNYNFNVAIGKLFWTYDESLHHEDFVSNIKFSDIKKNII